MTRAKHLSVMLLLAVSSPAAGEVAPPTVAVLPFEIVRGNDPSGTDKQAREHARLKLVAERLKDLMAADYVTVDVSAVTSDIGKVNLQACGNCGDDFAKRAGARLVVLGEMNKMSELILSLHVIVRDAVAVEPLVEVRVDLRGNTDESWLRAIDYLWQNALSSRLKTALKARSSN